MEATPTLWSQFGQFWSGQLFGGPSQAESGAPRLSSLALLVLLPGLLLYPCLGFHLFEPDESRYAQIPREMLQRGDLLLPTLQGEPYLDKPPLFYWLVMLSYQLLGVHDWSARLVPAVAVHLTILLTYLLGRRLVGERAALFGAVLLTIAPGFLSVSRLLILDGLLTLFVVAALFALLEATQGAMLRWSWWAFTAVALGLGVLTKGPVILLLVMPPWWLHRQWTRTGAKVSKLAWAVLLGIILAINLPWYVSLTLQLPGFVRYFFWEHNIQRFLAPEIHVRGVWFYLPLLVVMLLPASLLIWPLTRFYLSLEKDTASQRSAELGFCLLAGSWGILFFSLSSCKLPTYILPALPFLALCIGAFLSATTWRTSWLVRYATASSVALIVVAHFVALPWYAWYRSPMSRPAEVLELCQDRSMPIVCYPRNCDSIAFYLGRSDLRVIRSKDIEELRTLVRVQPRTVILCTHRHSLQGLKQLLPPEVRIVQERRMGLAPIPGVPDWAMKPLAKLMGETALGLADLAVVEMPTLTAQAHPCQQQANRLP